MDVRVERTKRALQGALLDLARERPFDELTVGAITERAEVNRSSFYQHYSDKETLLADALDAARLVAGVQVPVLTGTLPQEPPQELVDFIQHLEEHAALYRLALCEGGSPNTAARIQQRIEEAVSESIDLSQTSAYDGMPRDVVCAGVAGSALAVIERWLTRDPRPSTQVAAEWVWRVLIGPGTHV